jgi:hypothetical protein
VQVIGVPLNAIRVNEVHMIEEMTIDAIVNINLIHWPSKSDPLALA